MGAEHTYVHTCSTHVGLALHRRIHTCMCNEGLQCDVEWRYGIQKEVVVCSYTTVCRRVPRVGGWS